MWTDPGLKNGISVRELISTLKKKAQAGNELSNILSKSLHARKKNHHFQILHTQIGSTLWRARYVDCLTNDSIYGNAIYGGDGGFTLVYKDLGECSTVHPPACASFFFSPFLFEVGVRQFHSLGQDQSTVAHLSRDDRGRVFPDELRVSSFPDRFPHYARTAAVSPHRLS